MDKDTRSDSEPASVTVNLTRRKANRTRGDPKIHEKRGTVPLYLLYAEDSNHSGRGGMDEKVSKVRGG